MNIIQKARELFSRPAKDVLKTSKKRDVREVIEERVMNLKYHKHKALKKQAIKHLTYAERVQLGVINKAQS